MVRGVKPLAGDPLLAPLWSAVHQRLCRGDIRARSVITIGDATPDTRRAADRLLGRVSPAGQFRVPLADLEAALGRAGTDVVTVVSDAIGPIVDRRAARASETASDNRAWAEILSHPTAAEPSLAGWLSQLRNGGKLRRPGGFTAVLAALDVLAVLPSTETVGRAVLAATILGREHDLDDNTPAGRFVNAGLAARLGIEPPRSSRAKAELWASAGISFDAVSTPALTLGLRPLPCGPLTEAARRWADGGVPLPVPGAAVAAEKWRVEAGTVVSVCENPSAVEAAAARFGPAVAPLVCVSGMPGRAVTSLLDSLAGGGAVLRYHGDFGTGGITIANLIGARHGAEPWRMSAADHDMAVSRLSALGRKPAKLRGRVPAAAWDAHLAPSIVACGFEVTEEHVLDHLLDDLSR